MSRSSSVPIVLPVSTSAASPVSVFVAAPRPAPVELWCATTGRWVGGFTLVGRIGDGFTVRRESDGTVLPAAFTAETLRADLR